MIVVAERPYELTEVEYLVVGQIKKGMSNKQAAQALFRAESTIKFHLGHAMAKMGVASRSEMQRKWLREQEMPALLAGFVEHLFDVVDPGGDAPPRPALLEAAVNYLDVSHLA